MQHQLMEITCGFHNPSQGEDRSGHHYDQQHTHKIKQQCISPLVLIEFSLGVPRLSTAVLSTHGEQTALLSWNHQNLPLTKLP